MANVRNNASRRIVHDLRDIQKSPIPGISIHPVNDDIFTLHANITIFEGPYEGIIIHLVLNIPESFPQTSPAGKIFPGFPFTSEHHHHIYNTMGICNDYLSNFGNFFGKEAGTGWTPSITLKDLLLVLQPFLADPDFYHNDPVPTDVIERLRKNVATFECECGHSTKKPMPPLGLQTEHIKPIISNRVTENLICSISKMSIFDDEGKTMILGYPIHLRVDKRKRLWTTLIPEIISYEQYVLAIQSYNGGYYRSATGQPYTNWLPIYIDEKHFQRGLTHVRNCISVVSNGIQGTKENDFQPDMILRVLPALINKNIVAMMNGETHESESAIFAYCHFLRLFMRLLEMYPKMKATINSEISQFIQNKSYRNKSRVPDIGEFIFKLFLSDYSYNDEKVKTPLLEEYFARQIFWINKKYPGVLINKIAHQQRMDRMFSATEVSNKLLVFNIMAAKTFIFPGVTEKFDSNHGLPPEAVVSQFQTTIRRIKDISNHRALMQAISYNEVIKSVDDMMDFLARAITLSRVQGYTK